MTNNHCPMCATGALALFQEPDELQYKGQTFSVELEYAVCQQCGEEMILPEQIKRNDCRVRDVWRKADGLLTSAEIFELRKTLGLTQQEAAKVFGGGPNAFSKYERGEVIQSEGMDKLLRLALEENPVEVYCWLRERAGLAASPAQGAGQGYDDNVVPFRPLKSKPLIRESSEAYVAMGESEPGREEAYG
jgi:HTH-type transcriptional regulator / antitoxin MqsA